jgi:hypothetical protein
MYTFKFVFFASEDLGRYSLIQKKKVADKKTELFILLLGIKH